MRKLIIALTLTLSVAGCANFQNTWGIVSGATVSPTAVYVARNSFDAAEVSATNYIVFCKVHPATYGCSKTAIAKLIPAVRSGRVARNNLTQFQKDNPGVLGPVGLYNALNSATNTIQAISLQYNTGGVAQ